MRWMVVTVALVACAEPVERQVFGDVDGTDLLVDDPADAYPERVLAHAGARARLVPDGPRLQGGHGDPVRPLVVVDPGPWPRVDVATRDVQILLYLDRSELQPRVVALADGTGPDGDGRVVFPPGAAVEILDREDDRVVVSMTAALVSVEAWVPRAAVDEVWREDEVAVVSTEPSPEGLAERSVVGGAELRDTPSGHPIARIRGAPDEGVVMVTVVGEERRGWVPVVLLHEAIRVEGWAHVDDLRDEQLGWGCSCGGGLSTSGWSSSYLSGSIVPAGTMLRAGVDGPVVARVTSDLTVPDDAAIDGLTLSRTTPFGVVELWVGPEDVEPGAGR